VWALVVNLVVSIVVSIAVRVVGLKRSDDRTSPEDYLDVAET
jgi:SSS family solute:Na+ symporter